MKLQTTINIRLPTVPNYLMIDDGVPRPRNEEHPKIHISELTEEQAKQVAEEWSKAFIAKSLNR